MLMEAKIIIITRNDKRNVTDIYSRSSVFVANSCF